MKLLGVSVFCMSLLTSVCVNFACAGDDVLVRGSSGITITTEDVRQEMLMAQPDVRADIMSRPDLIRQTAMALYSRRFLAEEAVALGLDKTEQTAVELQRARMKILAETAMIRRDGAAPDDAVVEALALSQYKANPDKYMAPEKARAAHILIRKDKPDAKKTAQQLRDKLIAGANFAEMVQTYSDDEGSKARDGDLGLFAKGTMVKSFEDAVFSMTKAGEYSDVVETEFGFHVIKLYSLFKASVRPFEDVKEQVKREILAGLARERRSVSSDEIMKSASVDNDAIALLAKKASVR